jgi:hypothetical protein
MKDDAGELVTAFAVVKPSKRVSARLISRPL